jgi:hypothetical protein
MMENHQLDSNQMTTCHNTHKNSNNNKSSAAANKHNGYSNKTSSTVMLARTPKT